MTEKTTAWEGSARLERLLPESGLTTTGFAARCGVTENTARDWVKGNRVPSVTYLRPICEALAIDGQRSPMDVALFLLGFKDAA